MALRGRADQILRMMVDASWYPSHNSCI